MAGARLVGLARRVTGLTLTVGVTGLTSLTLTVVDAAHTGAQVRVPERGLRDVRALGGVLADAHVDGALTSGEVTDLTLRTAVGHPRLGGTARLTLSSRAVAEGASLAAARVRGAVKGAFFTLVRLSGARGALRALAVVADALVLSVTGLISGAVHA